jgi:hypothetical protein
MHDELGGAPQNRQKKQKENKKTKKHAFLCYSDHQNQLNSHEDINLSQCLTSAVRESAPDFFALKFSY